jgi:uncharacterized protein (TIGR02588 family)
VTVPRKNSLEWAVFGLGLALVLAAAGLVTYDAVTTGEGPPVLRLELGAPRPVQGVDRTFLVPVTVRNLGSQSAEGVEIEVDLDTPAGHETAGYTIAFVPRRSLRRGWVAFREDPRTGRLSGRVLGYEQP